MKSVLKVSLAALTLAFAVSSQAADKLVVATDTAFVPFEFKQGDKYVGFDVDLWAAVAKELKPDNNDVKSVKDLEGKVVAVKSGTGSVDYAKANIKTKDLRQFPNIDNAYMELGTNRADAVLHDTPNILYFIKTAGNGKFKAVGDSLEAQQYGIAFPKGSDDLRNKVNGALKTLKENGTYNEIYKKWFGTEPK